MHGIEYGINQTKRKFYRTIWLISVIAVGVTIGNIVSHSINSWNDDRKLKIALQEAEKKVQADLEKMDEEFKEVLEKQKYLLDEAKKRIQQNDMDSLDKKAEENYQQQLKDAECDYWIEQSKTLKTSESFGERLKACKAAKRSGY